jgi:hypothetical protein
MVVSMPAFGTTLRNRSLDAEIVTHLLQRTLFALLSRTVEQLLGGIEDREANDCPRLRLNGFI